MPDRFRGRPLFARDRCPPDCRACVEVCPVAALTLTPAQPGAGAPALSLDLGRCLFCADCHDACPRQAVSFGGDYRLATRTREALIVTDRQQGLALAEALGERLRGMLGRSLKLRQVSAGGCAACEADVNVLGTLAWDVGRFGIQFVASPRHADGLLVTGPVTENMRQALHKSYDAVPAPKIVIASGACAISGGLFADSPVCHKGAPELLPVDLFIPGCPPHPLTILDGLLRLLGRARD